MFFISGHVAGCMGWVCPFPGAISMDNLVKITCQISSMLKFFLFTFSKNFVEKSIETQ